MARDTLTIQTLPLNSGTAPTGQAVTAANGIMLQANDTHKVGFLYTSVASGTITLKAGTAPASGLPAVAYRAGLGDAAFTVGGTAWSVFTAETARFLQPGGSILIDFQSGMAGTIYAFKVPDTV